MAGSDQIKFGYVSRQNFKDASRHTILGMQNFKPQEFATQMALNMDNGWGIVRGKSESFDFKHCAIDMNCF